MLKITVLHLIRIQIHISPDYNTVVTAKEFGVVNTALELMYHLLTVHMCMRGCFLCSFSINLVQ